MTTIFTGKKACWACAKVSAHQELGSTNACGSPDLDLRPPEMQRSTMNMWIQRCPDCGYCAPDLAEGPTDAKALVQTEGYQRQLADAQYPELANFFLCFGLIAEAAGQHGDAGMAALHAAWVCDDAGKDTLATACRVTTIERIERVGPKYEYFTEEEGSYEALLTDLLRRCGQFARAVALCELGFAKPTDEVIRSILRFQQVLCRRLDTASHTVDEALRLQAS